MPTREKLKLLSLLIELFGYFIRIKAGNTNNVIKPTDSKINCDKVEVEPILGSIAQHYPFLISQVVVPTYSGATE